ncbi:monocarboxylate permease [Penicillium chermesinum]|nr:monocarboxylate permease [Penicillium chermesinum]
MSSEKLKPEELPQEDEVQEFPDGGLRAWTVVLGAWCGLTPTFAVMNIGGVLEAWLADHELKQYSKSTISWIFSLWCCLLYIGGIFVGPMFDKYGVRYTALPGSVGAVLSIMFLSVCTEYYQFILGFSVLGGLSFSTLITPSLGCVAHWFNKNRGLAIGVACTSGGIGGIIFTVIFGALSNRIGYPWTIRILGFISAYLDIKALTEPVFLATTLSVVLAEAGLIIPVIYLPSYALAHGIDSGLSYQLMNIFNATSIVGRIIPGILADRVGRFNVMTVTSATCGIFSFALWLTAHNNRAAILSFVALCGFWSGPAISLSPVCVAQVCQTKDYGKRYGTVTLLIGILLLIIVPVAGVILNDQNPSGPQTNYSGLICLCGGLYVCSSAFAYIAKGLKVGWKISNIF